MTAELAPGAETMGWDVLALGLPAAAQPFEAGVFTQRLEMPGQWLERGRMPTDDDTLLQGPAGWAGHTVSATLWFAAGTALPAARRTAPVDAACELLHGHALARTARATAPQPDVVLLRVLAGRVEPAMQLLAAVRAAWRGLARRGLGAGGRAAAHLANLKPCCPFGSASATAILKVMYASFFGLSKEPFSISPDPRFLFMSEQHREALAHLLYGLGGGGGFVLLTGEVGAGKTTVCRCFLEQVPAHCRVAYIFNPKLSVAELLQTVCGEFGIPLPAQADSVKAHVDALNVFLLAGHAQGRQAVLVIDEAQSLSAEVLEQLRLLTNLETAERKLLQIILIGQPELREMVSRPELEQLAQRIVARYHLGALSFTETQQYIQHRLAVAGPSAPLPFSAAALARIHALSGGVPRRINLLADRALLGAYAQGQQRAERSTVQQAAREVFGGGAPARTGPLWTAWRVPALAAMAGVAGVAALALLWAVMRSGAEPSAVVAAVTAPRAVASAPAAAPLPAPTSSAPPASPVPGSQAEAPPQAQARAQPQAQAQAQAADLGQLLAAAHSNPATAWRELALRWNVAIGEGEPCVAAAQARLACYRNAGGGLAVVRQLARPGVVSLRKGNITVYALLVALDEQQATLQAGSQRFVLPLAALAGAWRGDFASFWRLPPGWADTPDGGSDPAARAWLNQRLSGAGFAAGAPLAERVRGFQITQGLPPDGRAGAMTVMRLNRAAGVDEPRLTPEG